MKKEAENAQGQSAAPDSAVSFFDLPSLVQQLKEEESWTKNGRGARTLFKSESLRIVLNVMQKDTEIKPHQANGPISVQVLEGQIQFSTGEEAVVLRKGQVLTLKEYVRHSVQAPEEAAFLLTVAPVNA